MGDFPFMEFLAREYHGKANGTGNWWDYVKAHGLANACLAKDKDSIDRAEFLYQIEVDWYKGNHPLSFSEHRDLVSHHKAQLQEFRKATQINFESLKEEEVKLDMLDIFSEANLNQAYNFATSVFGKSQHCAEGFIIFSKQVMKSSVDVLAKIDMFPPCDFAVLGLGSVPSGVVTPYSDIEYVILIETDKNLDYFWKLAVESYFQINNLGESPLSIFKLKELAEATFSKPAVTGYRIDGFGSRAGNIPTGKPFGLHKIQTVEGMMELYKNGLKALLGDYTGDVADLLANSTLIYSTYNGERLYKAFSFERMTYEQNTVACNKHVAEKRLRSFSADMEKYSFMPVAKNFGSPQNFDITTKTDIFRFITLLALSLSTALGLDSKYVWKIFDNLLDKGLSKENHRYLQIVLGLSLYTRTVAYLELGTKSEHLSLYTYNQSAAHKKKHYHMPTNIFVILGCLLVPIKECTNHSVRKLILSALDPETNSFVAGFNINKALQEFLNGFQIVKSDFLQLVKVLNFVGKPGIALERLYFAVGHDNVDSSCHKFLKIIRDKYESQQIAFSHDDKSLAEMVCFIMMSEKKYSVTLSYLSWLIDNENSCQLCRIRYKILRSQCLNCCFAYADAYKTLIDAFQDLRLHLNVSSENTFYSHLKMLATTTECKDEKEALLFEVLTHAYSTLAATSRHLKFFMLANECIRLSKMISKPVLNKIRKNRRFQVSLTDLLGVIHSEKGEYNKALDFHQESLKQLQEMHGKSTNHRHIAIVYSNMGKVYRLKGDYKRSLEFYDKALKMRMEVFSGLRVHPDIGECYTDIGAVLLDNGNFNAALDSHRKSVEIAEKSNSQYLLAKAHYNLSHVYQKLGWHLKSLDELHKALYQVKSCIAFTSETFHPDIAECYSEMANVYTLLGDYQLSFDYRKQAEDMIKAIHQVADPYTSPTFNDLVNINHQKDKLIHKIHSSNMELDAYIVRHGENSNCPDMAKGFTNMGNLYQYLGDFSKAHTYFSKSLMIWKNISGSDSNNPHIASCYEDLGDVYSSKCDYSQSLDNYSKALEMRVCVYEGQADHPEIAASYSKMGKVKMKIGKYSESLRFHQEALNMRKRVFGQSMIHPDVAESYHNIGVLYNEMGLYTESLEYHNKSVNMMKAVYCDTGSHEKIARSFIYICDVYIRKGELNRALEYSKTALEVGIGVYGQKSNHPIIAAAYTFMARVYRRQSLYDKAIECCNKALTMAKLVYGTDSKHHDLAKVYNNFGNIYEDQGRHEEAYKYYKTALEHKQSIFGENTNHPDLCIAYVNIGFSNYKKNEYATAFRYYKKALLSWKVIHGEESHHLHLAILYNYMGLGSSSIGEYAQSFQYHQLALKMMNASFGEETGHPEKAKVYTKMAIMYIRMGDYTKALEQLFYSVDMISKAFEETSATNLAASNYRHLGTTYRHLGQFEEAKYYFNLSLSTLYQIYGRKVAQCDIAEVYCHLGRLHSMVGQYLRSFEYHQMSLAMRIELDHKVYVAQSFRALGKLYHRTAQLDLAQYCFTKAVPVSSKYPILETLQLFVNIATIFIDTKRYKAALVYLNSALNKQFIYDFRLIAYIYYLLGLCYMETRQFYKSWCYLQAALKFYKHEPQYDKQVSVQVKILLTTSRLLLQLGKFSQALTCSSNALNLSLQLVENKDTAVIKYVRIHQNACTLWHSLQLVAYIRNMCLKN